MSANPAQDLTPLTWVKGEIDLELALTRQYLDQFSAKPEDRAALKLSRSHLHQVSGVLGMVGLAGVHRFCLELESLLDALEAQTVAAAPSYGELLNRSLAAISHHLEELLDGEADVPVRLFPLLREAAAARGAGEVTEVELFFPDLSHVPAAVPEAVMGGDLDSIARAARGRYQKALVLWFRNTADAGSLIEMAAAVEAVAAAPLPETQRAFWWVAGAFLDALVAQALPLELPAKQLGAKIEQEMRRLAEGAVDPAERTLRDLLYQVARVPREVSERVRDVQLAYRLRQLLPSQKEQAETKAREQLRQPILAKMRELVGPAKEDWTKCTSGSPHLLGQLIEKAGQIKQLAAGLKHVPLERLATVIGAAANEVRNHPQRLNETLGIEMATAFLLLEHGVKDFTKLPAEFATQADAVVARVRAAALGQWDESRLPAAPPLDEIARQEQEKEVLGQLAQEITTNFGQAEEIIDAFFRNHAERAPLAQVEPVLKQVEGALSLLGHGGASELLRQCQTLVARFAQPDYAVKDAETELLADGLSSLGLFVHALNQGAADERTITTVLERFGVKQAPAALEVAVHAPPVAPVHAPAPTAPTEVALRDTPSDPELLGIFLEEAKEVLANIGEHARGCSLDPANRDALTVVRRGFHTLKGSGRMVGLTHLGEVAWALEQTMNKWLDEHKPATPPLLDLVSRACERFSHWVATLERDGVVDIAAAALVADATGLRTGEQPPAAAPAAPAKPTPEEPVEVIEITAPAGEPDVRIGSIAISAELFRIFSEEATAHLRAMERERDKLEAPLTGGVSQDFLRSAHTIAGSSRTAGLTFIGDLAAAIELRLQACMEGGRHAQAATSAAVLDEGIVLLGRIITEVTALRMPDAADLERAVALAAELLQPLPATVETPPALPPGKERRAIRDDLDPQLLPIFLEESQELIPMVSSELRAWRANPGDAEACRLLKRTLHTLKGSARMAGAMRLGELTHAMESRVEASIEGGGVPEAVVFDRLETEFDRLCTQIEVLQRGPEPAAPEPAAEPALAAQAATRPAAVELELPAQPVLRVRADVVDRLVNEAGEIAIARSRIEAEVHSIKLSLRDLTDNLSRLRNQLREMEIQAETQMQSRMSVLQDDKEAFDPLEFDRFTRLQELTRGMAESVNDVATIQQYLMRNLDESEKAIASQARMSKDLQQDLLRVRAIAFGAYAERFYRTVRQSARDLGKKATLDIRGSQIELDRSVMERVTSPIEHMLRNAIAHGIEAPQERLLSGKPEEGQIVLTINQEGNEVAITLADDGAGLNLARIREKAVARGLATAEDELSEAEIMQFIFAPGFSTAQEVSEVSGRGVGMDVVQSEVTALGGRVEVSSSLGAGSTFALYLPLTLAVAQVVLVKAAQRTYAVPVAMIEHLQEFKPEEIADLYAKGQIELRGSNYPFHYLPHVLGYADAAAEIKRYNLVLFMRRGLQRLAVHVDEATGNREVVVKHAGAQLATVPGVEGATVLGDGAVVLIINPVQFAQREGLARTAALPASAPAALAPTRPLVMVVDDSLTVRKITSKLLDRAGYEALTAKDGVEAIELLAEQLPEVMLVDIEMPRMDGFELTRAVRADPRTKQIPIIMITSRTAEKHRNYAAELGVNVYLGKPYQEQELLGHIAGFTKAQAGGAVH